PEAKGLLCLMHVHQLPSVAWHGTPCEGEKSDVSPAMALPSRLVRVLLPVAAILEAISLVGTAWGYAMLREHSRSEDLARFERLIVGAETALALRLATYEQALRGAAGLFNASSEVTPAEWDAYIASIRP